MYAKTIEVLFGLKDEHLRKMTSDDAGNLSVHANGQLLPVYFRLGGETLRASDDQARDGTKLYVSVKADTQVWKAEDIPTDLPLPNGATKADAAKWLTAARDLDVRGKATNPLAPASIAKIREAVQQHVLEGIGDGSLEASLAADMSRAMREKDEQWFRDYFESMGD